MKVSITRSGAYRSRWQRKGLGRAALALGTLAAVLATPQSTPRAEAAFPGRNGSIAFSVADAETGGVTNADIFVVGPKGQAPQQVTSGVELDLSPAWAPDGSSLAFERRQTYATPGDIYILSDGRVTNLTNSPTVSEVEPSWSPDGRRIVFAGASAAPSQEGTGLDLYVVNADGSNLRVLVEERGDQTQPVWSPDGKWIAYVHSLDAIGVVSSKGAVRRLLYPPTNGTPEFPDWSPNGKFLVFSVRRRAPGLALADIWIVDSQGGNPQNLTKSPKGDDLAPTWSPDGAKILFVANLDDPDGPYYLYEMLADGSSPQRLVDIALTSGTSSATWGPRP